jgi:AcrR family transcriptional regulator
MMAIDPVAPGVAHVEERILDATLRCIGRWGLAKTTLDDVAREAGCSRATVYRAFPGGKESLVCNLVAVEASRFAAGLRRELAAHDDLDDLLVAGITHTARWLTGHAALQFMLAHEPELILPRVAFSHMNEVLQVASAIVGPVLAPYVGADEAARAAEWVARLVFSYTLSPSDAVDVCDEDSVRALVRDFVLPGLAHRSTTT